MVTNFVPAHEDGITSIAYHYQLKLETGPTGLDPGWEICFSSIFVAGRNPRDAAKARSDEGLPLGDSLNCTIFQLPGTHRQGFPGPCRAIPIFLRLKK